MKQHKFLLLFFGNAKGRIDRNLDNSEILNKREFHPKCWDQMPEMEQDVKSHCEEYDQSCFLTCPNSDISVTIRCRNGNWNHPIGSQVRCLPYPRLIRPNEDSQSLCGSVFDSFAIHRSIKSYCEGDECDFSCPGGKVALPSHVSCQTGVFGQPEWTLESGSEIKCVAKHKMARTDRDMKIKERVEKMTLKRREEIANRLALEFYPELDRDHDFFRFKPRSNNRIFFDEPKTFDEARDHCESLGLELGYPETPIENYAMNIDAHDAGNNGFYWVGYSTPDGEYFRDTNGALAFPYFSPLWNKRSQLEIRGLRLDETLGDCAVGGFIDPDYTYWVERSCKDAYAYFCDARKYSCYSMDGFGGIEISHIQPGESLDLGNQTLSEGPLSPQGEICIRGKIFSGKDTKILVKERRHVAKFELKSEWKLFSSKGTTYLCHNDWLNSGMPERRCVSLPLNWRKSKFELLDALGCGSRRMALIELFQNCEHFSEVF